MVPARLILTFKHQGDERVHVRAASGIKIDGSGGLIVYSPQPSESKPSREERLNLGMLRDLVIRSTAVADLTGYRA